MSGGIRRIAESLGVAPSSVSRALADKPGVSAALRRKILAAADSLAYAPSPFASSLRTGKGQWLVLITSVTPTTIAATRNRALIEMAQARFGGVRLHVAAPGETQEESVRRALAWNPHAIVSCLSGNISSDTAARLDEKRVPLVAMDTEIAGRDAVVIDRASGVYQAARLMLLLKRAHPVFLTTTTLATPDARLAGARDGFASLKHRLEERHLHHLRSYAEGPLASGFEAAKEILRTRPADAIFCYSDETAIGVLRALLAAGVRVPDETLVIGFDDLPVAEYLTPSLTTVAQPVELVAEAVLDLCAKRIAQPDAPPTRLVFQTHLVVRESAPSKSVGIINAVLSSPQPMTNGPI